MFRTGEQPYSVSRTVELMAMIIAGPRSLQDNGRFMMLEEIYAEPEPPFSR